MPRNRIGQLISFAIESDQDQKIGSWIWVPLRQHDTVQKVASRRGHPELARRIADENGIRSVRSKLGRDQLKVPGRLRDALSFDVLADDQPPRPTAGYAKIDTVDRPQRVGLAVFSGYDPVELEIPVQFENFRDGAGLDVERDIALLERMAGRGSFAGAGIGPPPVIRVTTTNASGEMVPLIPRNYQWSPQNPSAPLWRISAIEWDPEPVRNDAGNRVRQKAVVTVKQYTRVSLATRSVSERAKAKKKKPAHG